MEIFKDIKGYEGLYKIGNLGSVYSYAKRGRKSKLLKQNFDRAGYQVTYLCRNNIVKTVKVHRLVCEAFHENPNNLPQVNHKDGVKIHNYADNLEWCTSEHNIRHAWKNKLSSAKKGQYANGSKLLDLERFEMIRKYAVENKTQKSLAIEYGISQSDVSFSIRAYVKSLIEKGQAIDINTIQP